MLISNYYYYFLAHVADSMYNIFNLINTVNKKIKLKINKNSQYLDSYKEYNIQSTTVISYIFEFYCTYIYKILFPDWLNW